MAIEEAVPAAPEGRRPDVLARLVHTALLLLVSPALILVLAVGGVLLVAQGVCRAFVAARGLVGRRGSPRPGAGPGPSRLRGATPGGHASRRVVGLTRR